MSQFILRKVTTFTSARLLNRGRYLSALPKHNVVGMPALSPTMTAGTIGKWTCKPGDKISPGDSLAEVETDKASVTFEAQDEFIIAKLLVEQGAEVKVGDPILVTVEEAGEVAAFANFSIASTPTPAAATVAPAAPTPVSPPKQVEAPKPTVSASPAPSPAPKPVPVPSVPPTPKVEAPKPAPTKPSSEAATFAYGTGVLKGALVNRLVADQNAYILKYGRTGHIPVKPPTANK